MTYIAKAALFCDHCGSRVECEPLPKSPNLKTICIDDVPVDGWMDVDGTHHLCPDCAGEYRRMKAEMDRKLKEFAGIKSISFDL